MSQIVDKKMIAQAFSAAVSAEGSLDVLWEHPRMINYLYDLVPSKRNQIVQIEQIYSTDAARYIRNAAVDPNFAKSALINAFNALKDAGLDERTITSSIECFVSAVPSLSGAHADLLEWRRKKNAESAVRYIALQLSAQDWDRVTEICGDTIKQYPDVSEPYLFRLLALYKLSSENEADLIDKDLDLKYSPDFQSAVLYTTSEARQKELFRYQEVQEQKKEKYYKIKEELTCCQTEQDCLKLAEECKSILSFRNTSQLLEMCIAKAQRVHYCETTYALACGHLKSARKFQALQKWTEAAETFSSAADLFNKILSHKDSELLAKECMNLVAYMNAVGLMEAAQSEEAFRKAAAAFKTISYFGDSKIRWKQCIEQAENCRKELLYRAAHRKIDEARRFQALQKWTKASETFSSAAGLFNKILSYKDSGLLVKECMNLATYMNAVGLMEAAQSEEAFRKAAAAFETISYFGDSETRRKQCIEQAENCRKEFLYQDAYGKINEAKKINIFNWRKYR